MTEEFKLLAFYYMSLMEGDTHNVDKAFELMKKYNILDEIICEDE